MQKTTMAMTKEEIIEKRKILEARIERARKTFYKYEKELGDLQKQCKHVDGWDGNDFGPGASRTCPICGSRWTT